MLSKGYPINVFYGYVTDGIFQNAKDVQDHAYQAWRTTLVISVSRI
jgi:hypothetical protein